jgi:hypothetical protein
MDVSSKYSSELIATADVRRLMEADDPDATLVIYQGRRWRSRPTT